MVAMSLGYAAIPVFGQQPTSNPAQGLNLKTPTLEGCFSSSEPLQDQGSYTFQALGWCQPLCVRMNKPVLAFFNGTNCWCGDELPASSSKVSDSQCDVPCNGFPADTCGGTNAYMVYLTGTESSVANFNQGSSSPLSVSPSPTSQASPSVTPAPNTNGSPTIVKVASTVFLTAPNETSEQVIITTQVVKPTGTNKAAIAAGAVVGVVALCAILGGLFFFFRQKRRKEMQEEHRRSAAMISNLAAQGEKPPSTLSLSDSRLEPSAMFSRRQSDGSIADNHDYSRRILKVTNPDGS
ncbi:hypothetical protein MMC14_001790 [Varicellaria rhodocarpa]|nr:hypothetical protein [Varicellaria rhodocarpa]